MRDSVRRFFDDHSESWRSRYFRRDFDSVGYQDRMNEAFRLLERHAGRRLRILDVGCGAGVQAAQLRRRGHEVFACDIAAEMCRHTSAQIGRCAVVAVGERLPFASESFDAVIALGVIGYSSDQRAFLHSMRRVLRPGGLLVISSASNRLLLTGLSARISRWPDVLYRRLKQLRAGPLLPVGGDGSDFYSSHYTYLDAREFDRLLIANGWQLLGDGGGVNFGRLHFMGKSITGERLAIALTRGLTRLSHRLPALQRFARIYVTAVRKPREAAEAGGDAARRPARQALSSSVAMNE